MTLTTDFRTAHDRVVEGLQFLTSRGTATNIANYLSDHGHTGKKKDAGTCPLASYLSDKAKVAVYVGQDHCSPLIVENVADGLTFIDLPEQAKQFIRLFDAGVYPDLDEELH